MSDDTIEGRRFALTLPNGEVVTVTATPEILATAKRVRAAIEQGRQPDTADLVILFTHLAEDS